MTAKKIYDLIRNKPYKDGEKMIKEYAKQKVLKRDEEWKSNFHFTKNFAIMLKQLPEPEFE